MRIRYWSWSSPHTGLYAVGHPSRLEKNIDAYMQAVTELHDEWEWVEYCVACGEKEKHKDDCSRVMDYSATHQKCQR